MDLTNLTQGSEIFICKRVLANDIEGLAWRYHRREWKNQHEIWRHGNKLISQNQPSQQDFEAAIIQFHRAVEHRDALLDDIYGFEKIPGVKGQRKYAVMADLGIIRPTLKVRLRELRNSLVHDPKEGIITPAECELLSDTVWYYLKVTDRIAQQCADELSLQSYEGAGGEAHLTMMFQPVVWTGTVNGFIGSDALQETRTDGCLAVKLTRCEYQKYNDQIKFFGEITGTDSAWRRLVQSFFDESIE